LKKQGEGAGKAAGPGGQGRAQAGAKQAKGGAKSGSRAGQADKGGAVRKKLELAIKAGQERDYQKAALLLEELLAGVEAPPEAYLFLGRALHVLGDYSRALACFDDYLRLRPGSPQGCLFAGRTCLAIGMPQKAVFLLRKARAQSPDNLAILALLGTAYLKSRHSQLAADTFALLVEAAAEKGLPQKEQSRFYRAYLNALLVRGIKLCRIDEYDLGSQMLRFVLENAKTGPGGEAGWDSPLLRLELGRACRELGELPQALEQYTEALKHSGGESGGDIWIRWNRASILMALGENQEALGEIEEIRSMDSGLPDLPWNSRTVDLYMIRAFMDAGEWRRAADSSRHVLKDYGPDPLVHALYAEAFRNLKHFRPALNHLERALELEPGNISLWYERLLVSWEAGDWKSLGKALRSVSRLGGDENLAERFSVLLEANTSADDRAVIALLQKAIGRLGPEPELMYALGERYLKTGLVDLALSWFKKVNILEDRHEKARLGEIAALEALSAENVPLKKAKRRAAQRAPEQYSAEIRAAYDAYVKRWPDNFIIRRERALYLLNTFEYEEAVREFEALLAREPSNPSLRRVLAYGYRKTGRYREAAIFLKSLLKEKPRNIEILLEYSGCLERSGAFAGAKAILEKARALLVKAAEIPMALALLYAKERKLEAAFDLLREAAALNKRDPRPYRLMAALAAKKGDREGQQKYEYEAKRRACGRCSPGL
jgi:tetratricopeptide (TPR) repeat protein